MNTQNSNNCNNCIHYYITWDKNFPKGCKGFGFKCVSMPNQVVKQSSGESCKMYRKKEK